MNQKFEGGTLAHLYTYTDDSNVNEKLRNKCKKFANNWKFVQKMNKKKSRIEWRCFEADLANIRENSFSIVQAIREKILEHTWWHECENN